uniref:Protein disulfide-isomerase n=1 Tax=Aceria tosichella TaxID=561515 RepID=A0A6G1S3N2_9ACAR
MRYIIFLQLLCLGATLVSASEEFEQDEGIVVLKGDNFQKALEHYDNLLVEFYAPWCGHCKAFAPDYVKIAAILKEKGENVACAKVDAPEEHDLIEKYDIQGFPTLKLFRKDKKPDSYQGFRSVDALVDWVTRKIGPPAVVLEDGEAADKFKDSADVVVVGYFKDPAANESLTFSEIADQYDDFKFAVVHKEDVATKLGFAKDGVKLFKKFDEGEVAYDKDLKSAIELKRFIQANSLPLVVTFDQKNAQKIFGGDIKAHNLLFISKSDSRTDGILEEFKKSAAEFKEKVLFVVIDSDQDEHERIIEYFGLKKDELPGLRFIKLHDKMTKYKYAHDELVADKITEFVSGVLDNKIKPHLLTQDLPEDWDKNPVKVLVGTNFDEVAFDKTKDVLVEFYAPWCGHCKALAPTWEQLGEKYKDHETIVIAKMDAASNELEHTSINSYPTIKLYKKETNEVVEYNGERTTEGLVKFLETNGEYGRAAPDDVSEEMDEPDVEAGEKPADKHDEL